MGKGLAGRQGKLYVQVGLTTAFFFVEIIVGHMTNSISLVADSFHMLSDIFSLLIGIYAVKAAKKTISEKNTYGWIRAEVLGALINGIFLLALCFSIVIEAIQRFFTIEEIKDPKLVLIVGGVGLFINIIGLFMFSGHGHSHGGGGHGHAHSGAAAVAEATHDEGHGHSHEHGHSHGDKKDKKGKKADKSHKKEKHAHGHGHGNAHATEGGDCSSAHSHGGDTHGDSHGDTHESHGHSHSHGAVELSAIADPAHPPVVSDGVEGINVVATPEHPGETAVNMGAGAAAHGSHGNMNMHGVFLHVLGDALGSIAVMISATVIWLSDWSGRFYMDPVMSLLFTTLIIVSTVPLVKHAALILLQSIPKHINLDMLRDQLVKMPGVVDIHELHVWQLADEKFIATVHVTCDTQQDYMTLAALMKALFHSIGVHSTTIQPEFIQLSNAESLDDDKLCLLDCGDDDNASCKTNVCCTSDKNKLVRRKTANRSPSAL
eukprot:Opistho-2@22718